MDSLTFTPKTAKAIEALQRAEKSSAFHRVAAFVIIPPLGLLGHEVDERLIAGPAPYGKIKVLYPADGAGKLQVWVWDTQGNDIQYGKASGFGYDKLAHALKGMSYDAIVFEEDWREQLRQRGYTVIQAV
jgi:hypothetical protein